MASEIQKAKLTTLGAAIGCTKLVADAIHELHVVPGDPQHVPHDCLENLQRQKVCSICGAIYEEV